MENREDMGWQLMKWRKLYDELKLLIEHNRLSELYT